ncbi:MAG: hypothetical protein IJK60_00915 [Clostridia bacterium]|nr:hypothetical protein [Clostridia bacterium]
MRNTTKKVVSSDGTVERVPVDMKRQLNYNIANLLNKTHLNDDGFPVFHTHASVYPDYIAMNNEKHMFHKTQLTALGFYTFDRSFDNIHGLYNAIYYNDVRLLKKYKEMYAGIKFVIGPDYSMFDNSWPQENESRLLKIRIIMLWFIFEIGAIAIPNVVYLSAEKLPHIMSGFEECEIFCFSLKGHMRYAVERNRVIELVKYITDNTAVKTMLVYSVCGKDENALKLFSYAIERGIDVRIVDNTLRQRNINRLEGMA